MFEEFVKEYKETNNYNSIKLQKLIEKNKELYFDILTMNSVLYGYDYSNSYFKEEINSLKKILCIGDFISYLDYYKPYRSQIRDVIMFIINNKIVSEEECNILNSIATRKKEDEV